MGQLRGLSLGNRQQPVFFCHSLILVRRVMDSPDAHKQKGRQPVKAGGRELITGNPGGFQSAGKIETQVGDTSSGMNP